MLRAISQNGKLTVGASYGIVSMGIWETLGLPGGHGQAGRNGASGLVSAVR